jgi:hypothetical protein
MLCGIYPGVNVACAIGSEFIIKITFVFCIINSYSLLIIINQMSSFSVLLHIFYQFLSVNIVLHIINLILHSPSLLDDSYNNDYKCSMLNIW